MFKWREVEKTTPKGILVASDETQQWLLPWWWENYSKHNTLPVTFVDFGLSEEGKAFCKERGELVGLPFIDSIGKKETTDAVKGEFWESIYGSSNWWGKRVFWHKKPIALLQSPYERTLWLDIDCEVHDSIDLLFEKILEKNGLLLCPEPEEAQNYDREKGIIFADEVLFNSGVIGFTRHSPYILHWVERTLKEHGSYLGDQNLLSRLIYEEKWPVQLLDPMYNWRQISGGKRPDVKITHWVGEAGKFFLSLKKLHLIS